MKKMFGKCFFGKMKVGQLSEYPSIINYQLMFVIQLFQYTTENSDIWCTRSIYYFRDLNQGSHVLYLIKNPQTYLQCTQAKVKYM